MSHKIVTSHEIESEMEKWADIDFLLRVLLSAEPYIVESLSRHDDAYNRHPSSEQERKSIVEDLQLLHSAIAELKGKL